jgi:phosphatidylglycerol:prolipoprotein diacylglycerol transferase
MKAILLHLYGPLAIQSYGLFIALGVGISLYFLSKDSKLNSLVTNEQLMNCFQIGIISAVLGGRVLFFINHMDQFDSIFEFFALWQGGLSILGSVAMTITALTLYLRKNKVPLLPFLDRAAIYAPFMQGLGRVGCFFSGCCYGQQTHSVWAVTYTDINSKAPLYIAIHPTQIYSSLLLLSLFSLLFFYLQRKIKQPGLLFFTYLSLMSVIRFGVDFLRWDREFSLYSKHFSISQLIAILIFVCGITGLLTISFSKKNH